MPNDDQAQADATDPQTAIDPLDAMESQMIGANELSAYEAEVEKLTAESSQNMQGDESAASGEEDQEDDEVLDGESNEELSDEELSEEDQGSKSDRFRIRAKDSVETEALSLRKRHPEWSLKDCIAKAEQILGVHEESSPEAEGYAEERETVASVSERIKELRGQRKEAQTALEFETAAEIDEQLDSLLDRRQELRTHEEREQSQSIQRERQQFDAEYEKSERIAVAYYPDATKADSELVKRMVELDVQMRDLGDELYHSPNKPLLLAKIAARELGIPMTDPKKPAVKAKSSSNRPMQPASGNARTTATAPALRQEEAIAKIDSLDAYERFVGIR